MILLLDFDIDTMMDMQMMDDETLIHIYFARLRANANISDATPVNEDILREISLIDANATNSAEDADRDLNLIFRLGNCSATTIEKYSFQRISNIEEKYLDLNMVLENAQNNLTMEDCNTLELIRSLMICMYRKLINHIVRNTRYLHVSVNCHYTRKHVLYSNNRLGKHFVLHQKVTQL